MSKESTGKRITSELREWASTKVPYKYGHQLGEIADRIDAAHEEAIKSVMNDALYHANDKDMADLGWYRALDEDNVPWRIGDRDEYGNEVVSIRIAEQGHFYFTVDGGLPCRANIHSHYHAPTVEDVLREFADEVRRCCDSEQTIAEYAKRLQLREGDES